MVIHGHLSLAVMNEGSPTVAKSHTLFLKSFEILKSNNGHWVTVKSHKILFQYMSDELANLIFIVSLSGWNTGIKNSFDPSPNSLLIK